MNQPSSQSIPEICEMENDIVIDHTENKATNSSIAGSI